MTDADTGDPIYRAYLTCGGKSATSGTDGQYRLTGLSRGTHNVRCSASGYELRDRIVTLSSNSDKKECNFGLEPTGSPPPETARVYGDITDAGTGAAIANAAIKCGGLSTSSDRSGEYEIGDIAPGDYALTCDAAGYTGQSRNISLRADEDRYEAFALDATGGPPETGSIFGHVTDADTGQSIEGARVACAGRSVETNMEGLYILHGLDPGSYTVACSADAYTSAQRTARVTGGATTRRDFSLVPVSAPPETGGIEGIVCEARTGDPIEGCLIFSDGLFAAITDPTGKYSMPKVAPGRYNLLALAEGYESAVARVGVEPDRITIADFRLRGEGEGRGFPIWPVVGIGAALVGTAIVMRNR